MSKREFFFLFIHADHIFLSFGIMSLLQGIPSVTKHGRWSYKIKKGTCHVLYTATPSNATECVAVCFRLNVENLMFSGFSQLFFLFPPYYEKWWNLQRVSNHFPKKKKMKNENENGNGNENENENKNKNKKQKQK